MHLRDPYYDHPGLCTVCQLGVYLMATSQDAQAIVKAIEALTKTLQKEFAEMERVLKQTSDELKKLTKALNTPDEPVARTVIFGEDWTEGFKN